MYTAHTYIHAHLHPPPYPQDPVTSRVYVYWRTRISTGLDGPTGFRAMQLAEDCLDVMPESDLRVTVTPNREGPAMFLHNKTYYLWVSNTMGWQPTSMFVYAASSPLGNFSKSNMAGHQYHSYTKGTVAGSILIITTISIIIVTAANITITAALSSSLAPQPP